MKKRMLFIEPRPAADHIFSKYALPRIGTLILGTMMKERGWDVTVIVEDLHELTGEDFIDVGLVGISTITNTTPRAYELADRARALGIPVIMGGPHVTFMPDEALSHADYVIRGEGEESLMALVDALEGGGGIAGVPGLSYRDADRYVHTPARPGRQDLDSLPIPDLTLLKDGSHLKVLPVQTSRGCPYDCSFCSVTGMFGRGYRFRSTEHILTELRRYKDMGKMIFFYDDHFAANRKRAKDLLNAMIDEGLSFKWSTQVRVDIARDHEMVELMKRAGCHTLFIGFESVNPESLKEMKKGQTVEDIVHAVEVIQKAGINIHGMFVHGFDQDSKRSVRETVRFARRIGLSSAQFLILTPFPGSELYENLKDRIVFRDWAMYDAHHVVYRPVNFSLLALQKTQSWSHERFYSAIQITANVMRRRWLRAGLGVYARLINSRWKRENRGFLIMLGQMT